MKPHNPKPSKRAADRSARAHLRNALGWLEGFPTGQAPGRVRWRAFGTLQPGGTPVEIDVDRERLRSSTYGLRGARRMFPRALPRVVGDVDAWSTGVERRLQLLKAVVHDGAPLPTARALAELFGRTSRPAPKDLDAALLWALWDRPEHWPEALRRLGRWRLALAEVAAHVGDARELALEVALRPGAAEILEPFRRMLGDRRTWTRPQEDGGFRERLAKTLKRSRKARADELASFLSQGIARPEACLGHELVKELAQRPGETDLRALGALLSPTRLDEWDTWWCAAESIERQIRSALGRALLHERARGPDLGRVATEMERRLEGFAEPPLPWNFASVRHNAAQFAARCEPALAALVLDAWEAVPDGPAAELDRYGGLTSRGVIADRWTRALHRGLAPRRLAALARAQLALLREHGDHAADLLGRAFTSVALEDDSGALGAKPALLAAFVATLGELARRGEVGAKLLVEVGDWEIQVLPFLAETKDPVRAADMLQAWSASGLGLGWTDEHLLARLCGEDVLDAGFWRAGRGLDWELEDYKGLLRAARSDRARDLFRALMKDGEQRRLNGFARLYGAATATAPREPTDEPPPATVAADDLSWLPKELRDEGQELQSASGRKSLDRALRDDVRRPTHIAAEMDALEQRIRATTPSDALHLRARLATLQRRSTAPPRLSPARVAACRKRILRRTNLARLETWEAALRGLVERYVPAGLVSVEDPSSLQVIGDLMRLRPAARDLAWRLLKLHRGGADLRDEPANLGWRRRMEAQGLNLVPWLDPPPEPETVTPGGRHMRFAFEKRPLEIFQMGSWFGTCLSPGEENFFSTVANAADANKRVLVARDPRGKVQARCLFALTRRAELLAFHVYAHEEGDWARERVHEIAATLARAVGTRLVPAGEVETLVAPAWYDDGPVDLTGRLDELRRSGPVVEAIRAAEPGELPRILAEELGPELLDVAIDQIVTHEVFGEDPARLLALGPLLRERRLAGWAAIDVARRVVELDPDLARAILMRFMRRRRGRRLGVANDRLVRLARTLLTCDDPGLALRVLRQVDDPDPDSEHAEVTVLLRLHRPRQAAEKLEQLARSGDDRAARRLEALETPEA